MMVIRAGILKLFIRIASREYPGQTASSDLGLPCLNRPFWQATSVRNFRTLTIIKNLYFSNKTYDVGTQKNHLLSRYYFFIMKMSSAFYICYIYSSTLQARFFHGTEQ